MFEAVVLAGGRGSRLGGADKPGLRVGTDTLAARVVAAAVGAGALRVILVGPPRPELPPLTAGLPGGLMVVREDPAGAGPVPALRCGLTAVDAQWAAVLAADLPFLTAAVLRALLLQAQQQTVAAAATAGHATGAVFVDHQGRPQWLVGCWRAEILRTALRSYRGESLHSVLAPLEPALVSWDSRADQPPPWLDCDSPADLDRARRWEEASR